MIHVDKITDQGLLLISESAPQLETLDLWDLRKIQGDSLAEVVKNLPQLTLVSVYGWGFEIEQNWRQILIDIKQDRPELRVLYLGDEIQ